MATAVADVVFLDVDGVLLPFGDGAPPPLAGGAFPSVPLEALSHVLEATGARLVLSSTWRCLPAAVDEILANFRRHAGERGGPLGGVVAFSGTTSLVNHSERQWEIAEWLASDAGAAVRHWVALDDEEMLEGAPFAARRAQFEGHVVKTASHVGLTMPLAEAAVELLRRQRARTAAEARPPARRIEPG